LLQKEKMTFFKNNKIKKANIYLRLIVELNKRQRRGVLWVTWLFEWIDNNVKYIENNASLYIVKDEYIFCFLQRIEFQIWY